MVSTFYMLLRLYTDIQIFNFLGKKQDDFNHVSPVKKLSYHPVFIPNDSSCVLFTSSATVLKMGRC